MLTKNKWLTGKKYFFVKLGQTFGICLFAFLTFYGKDPGNDLGLRLNGICGFLLCVAAMEPPYALSADVVRDAKAGVLHCLRPMTPETVKDHVVRGQYIEGDEHGHRVASYRHECRKYFEEWAKKPIPPESVNSTSSRVPFP